MKELLPIPKPVKLRQGMYRAKVKARMLSGYENIQLNKSSKQRLLKIRIKYPLGITETTRS